MLLGLPNYYTISCDIKSINISIFQLQFPDFALHGHNQSLSENNVVQLCQQTNMLSKIFDHYFVEGNNFQKFCFYIYDYIINIILYKVSQKTDIKFRYDYKNRQFFVQCHITKCNLSIIKLLDRLYNNKKSNSNISIGNTDT